MESKKKQLKNESNSKPTSVIPAALVLTVIIAAYIIVTTQKGAKEVDAQLDEIAKSIAVLPFVNMTGEPAQQYFSDGLTEGILNSLARLEGLKVTARTSSFTFRETNVNLKEVGRKLGVRTILEGSVQRQGERIRITAQLINVEDDFHFWSEQYDENIEDVFALQDKIAAAIAEKLKVTLLDKPRPAIDKQRPPSKGAYDLYLKGRSSWNLRTPPELKKGIEFFEQAIALDSSYAAAYAGIADCYTALGYASHLPPKVAFPKAMEAAAKALRMDSTLAEPHAVLGHYLFYHDWDWAAAEQEFRKSIALNSNYEIGYDYYGYYLTAMERYDEAQVMLKKAVALDPLSAAIRTDLGFSLYYSGQYLLAKKELEAALELNPAYPLAHIWLGRVYQAEKMYTEAISEYKNALEVTPEWPVALAQIGNAYGVSGKKSEARTTLNNLLSLSSRKYVTSYGVALVYAALGETEGSLQSLNNAYLERSHWLVWLKTDPRWASLRSEKQFAELLSRVGLPHVNE